jgi:hypothetical protein
MVVEMLEGGRKGEDVGGEYSEIAGVYNLNKYNVDFGEKKVSHS